MHTWLRRRRSEKRPGHAGRMRVALAVLGLMALAGAAAAVAINPVALYIDSRSRSGVLTLYNDGTRPEEVQIAFAFGYPRSDSTGQISVALTDTAGAGEPSAVPWVSAFPRRLVLQPGQRQAVRILVEPPAGTADGEYWARVLVKSRGGQPPVEQEREDGVRIRMELETVVAVPLSYRHGQVGTGIEVPQASARLQGDTVQAVVDLRRTGNAAFLGRLTTEILDADGRVLARAQENLGVYRELRRVVRVAVPSSRKDQPLRTRFRVEAGRDDLPAAGPLPASTVQRTVEVSR